MYAKHPCSICDWCIVAILELGFCCFENADISISIMVSFGAVQIAEGERDSLMMMLATKIEVVSVIIKLWRGLDSCLDSAINLSLFNFASTFNV